MAKLKIAIIAGEASGDILGGGLIEAMKARYPDAQFYGIGGELMIGQGLTPIAAMEQLSVMGLFEVLARLPSLLKLRKKLIADFISSPPDLFIGIDAPDFNLNIELALKQAGILTVHYVSPSVWAWKHKRIYKIKQAVDLLLTLFPFEQQHYAATGQKIAFVGHPLAKLIPQQYSQQQYKKQLGFAANDTIVALLPGSRSSETKYLTPVFLRSAVLLWKKHPQLHFVLPAANRYRYDEIALLLKQYPQLPVKLILKDSRAAMAAADAILIASGTATLEAALLAKPMVVAYKMASLTYAIYSRMLRVKYVSLPNLLADEMLVPERLQNDASPENLCSELEQALFNQQRRDHQIARLKEIHQQLDLPANERAADAIVQLLKSKPGQI